MSLAGEPTAWAVQHWMVARHGETEWNRIGRRQGELDSPLTETGLIQASELANAASMAGVDVIYSSPQGRAVGTARVIAARLGVGMFTLEGLREVRHGKMAGLTDLEIRAKFPEAWAERDADRAHWRFPQGESYFDAAKRVSAALAEIDSMGYRRPLLVAHEMISRLIRGRLLGIPLEKAIELRGTQGSLEVLQPARSCELEPESSAEREGRNDMAD